jgi:hypothetical protein
MGHITDDDEAQAIVRRLLDALPPGSYLALYDVTRTSKAFEQAQEGLRRHRRRPVQAAQP